MSVTNQSPEQAQRLNRLDAQIKAQINMLVINHLDEGFKPVSIVPDDSGSKAWLHLERSGKGKDRPEENHIHIHWSWLDTIVPIIQKKGFVITGLQIWTHNESNPE